MLTPADVKEEFSFCYLGAVAAKCGFAVEGVRRDRDSIDATVQARGKLADNSLLRSPKLDVQLKARTEVTEAWSEFPLVLSLKNYNELRDPASHVPRVLVVLVLPAAGAAACVWSPQELVLRRCCYWLALAGRPAVERSKQISEPTVTVRVPRCHMLSPETLWQLMLRVSQQRDLDGD
ncbi:MAG: DUF4365 domain-containing protein [Fimbriimonadaceae bacterium]|nr:DUF4365 domain-containing protein [Fimbriimonadaceae bacterium]